MIIESTGDEAAALFDGFVAAGTCSAILNTFHQLCDVLDLHTSDDGFFFDKLKGKLSNWKANALWTKLEKHFNLPEYDGHRACRNTSVLVIGGGPCGLRAAIECKLLGARTVVVEKRDRFSRNNVLHLWPFVIHDLKSLGAKIFYPKFCAGSLDHISIRQLQCILLKIALLVGVEVYVNIGYVDLIEPTSAEDGKEQRSWRALVDPHDHPVSCFEFDVVIGADGKRNTLKGFKRKEFRGKLAIAITANFINHQTTAEARVEEISGVAFIFNQKFFKDLNEQTGIDLENIVYYKDSTHYFVMTAKKQSLLDKGVLLQDHTDTVKLLSRENVNQAALLGYATQAADVSTKHQLPKLEFAHNHFGEADVAMFDFTSMFAAEYSCQAKARHGRKLLIAIVGDSLLEPFWPTGSGCARGFLGTFDACWAVRSWASGHMTPLEVLAERESVYQLLSQSTPENLSKNFGTYTINPTTRYRNCNLRSLRPIQVRHLYDTTEEINVDELEPIELPAKRAKTFDIIMDQSRLLRWCQKRFALLPTDLRCEVSDLTTDWKNGTRFCLLLHLYLPSLVDITGLSALSDLERLQLAFSVATDELGIVAMMTPEEIASSPTIDKLFMVSFLSQFYRALRPRRPLGAAPEALVHPALSPVNKPQLSPSGNKVSSLRRLGKIPGGPGSRQARRRRSSGLHSPKHGNSSTLSPEPNHQSTNTGMHSTSRRTNHIGMEAEEKLRQLIADSNPKISNKELKSPGHETVKSRLREIRDAFSLKSRKKSLLPKPSKKKAEFKENWTQDKYTKLEEIDVKLLEVSRRIARGNLGNVDPGIRGQNLVSNVASKFEKLSPAPSPALPRKTVPTGEAIPSQLEMVLNREPTASEVCFFCKTRVFLVEKQSAEGKFFHRSCFRCYYCETSLHIGNYSFYRTLTGVGRFYCNQHIGQEKPPDRKRSMVEVDGHCKVAAIGQSDRRRAPFGDHNQEGQDYSARRSTLFERAEFENNMSLLEESEESQVNHNLSGVSDDLAEAAPNGYQKSAVLCASTPNHATSHSQSVVRPRDLDLSSSDTQSEKKSVSILRQPVVVPPLNSSPTKAPSTSRATVWSQQLQAKSPPSQSSQTVQDAFKRRSTFFSEAPEPVRLDPRTLLEQHPASSQCSKMAAVDISLDTLQRKESPKDPSSFDSVEEQRLDPPLASMSAHVADSDVETPSIVLGESISDEFITKTRPKAKMLPPLTAPIIIPQPLSVDTAVGSFAYDHNSDDASSESSFTISTPSDGEYEGMSPVGTLLPNGKLAAPGAGFNGSATGFSLPFTPTDEGFTTADSAALTDSLYHTPCDWSDEARKKIPLDASLRSMTFDLTDSSSAEDMHDDLSLSMPENDYATVDLDGRFQQMCLDNQTPTVASEEEFTDDGSDSDDGVDQTEKIRRAAIRQQKQQETKRLRMAQEIQRQLQEVEVKQKALETEGVALEKVLRSNSRSDDSTDANDDVRLIMQKWFNVVHQKSLLLRYESELLVRARELELEDRHCRLTNQLRERMLVSGEKSAEDIEEEKRILNELLEAVEQRDQLVQMLETERLKERREDEELQAVMSRKGFELSPVPYMRVTFKKGYSARGLHQTLAQ